MRSSLVCVSHWLVLMLYTGQVYYGGKWTAAGVVAALSALPPHTRQALLRRADADARGTNQYPFLLLLLCLMLHRRSFHFESAITQPGWPKPGG